VTDGPNAALPMLMTDLAGARVRTQPRTSITALSPRRSLLDELAADLAGLQAGGGKAMPPKWFYDGPGSSLFDQITELDEYYPTRTELGILERTAADLVAAVAPEEIVELGSGSSRKTRVLLEAMHAIGSGSRYAALDFSVDALEAAARALTADYPWLQVAGYIGDFHTDLHRIPHPTGRRLVAFLGSTIGNFPTRPRRELLAEVRRMLGPDDRFVVGLDLVKEPAILLAAYDDAAGVTAEFNRNMLRNFNAVGRADFPVEAFTHVVRWNAVDECIELSLRAERDLVVTFEALGERIHFKAGEELFTEHSCKFTRASAEADLRAAGLELEGWETDEREWFAVALVRPAA